MKKFLNTIEESVCLLDLNKRLVYLNEAALESLGYATTKLDVQTLEQKIETCKEQVYLYIKNTEGKWCHGTLSPCEVGIEGKSYLLGKIQWHNRSDKKRKAELIEAFVENLNQSVCIKDQEGYYMYANKHYRERVNASAESIIGKKDEDYWDEQYSKMFREYDEYTLKTNMECVIEEEVIEEEKYFETTKFPIMSKGAYLGVIIKDITLQKILYNQLVRGQSGEDSLSKLQQTIKSLKEYFNTNQVNIWLYDEEKEHVTPCFNLESIREELGEDINIPMFRNEAEIIKNRREAVVKTNTLPFRRDNTELDETKHTFYVVYYPIVYKDKLLGILNIVLRQKPQKFIVKNYFMHSICQHIAIILGTHNLNSQLQQEYEQRMNTEEDLRRIVNSVTDLIIKVDENGRFTWVNEGCKQILGWREETFFSIKWQDLIHPEDYEKARATQKEWDNGEKKHPCINRYGCSDGGYKWLRWDGYYPNKEGTVLLTAKDISHEVELEAKERLAKEVLQIEKLRSEFFANLSHEFKTPLTIIMAALQMLEGMNLESLDKQPEQVKYIRAIRQNSYRLLRLVNNLIDVTKIDAGYYDLKMNNHNIIYVVEDIVMSVAEYAKNQDIEIVFDTELEEEVIACDPDKIERIMLNLLSNAIKYTSEAGKIQISIRREEDEILIRVEDNGVGISAEKTPYIFERFMQVNDVLTRHCEGSGIGLSLVKSLVELHGGKIEVESKLREGTRFEVRLPRLRKDEEGLEEVKIDHDEANERRIEKCHVEFSDIYKM